MDSYKSSYQVLSSFSDGSSGRTYPSTLMRSEIHQISSSFHDMISTKFIIYNPVDDMFQVFPDTRSFFSKITGNIYVISVSGNACIGKSTLLNLLASMINHLIERQGEQRTAINSFDSQMMFREIFKVGDGYSTTTKELDYVCLKWESDNILFLDLEGNDDPNRANQGTWIYTNLILASVALSHIHLHNFRAIPGATFLSYFNDIMKLITQSKLHKEGFKPLMYFVKKDDINGNVQKSKEAIKRSIVDKGLLDSDVDYQVEVIKTPPELFLDCMNNGRPICDACKKSSYITDVGRLATEIFGQLPHMTPYSSGEEVLQTVERILLMNEGNLADSRENGGLSSYIEERLKNEQLRRQRCLLNIRSSSGERKFFQNIIELCKESPQFIGADILENSKNTLNLVQDKLPRLSFLLIKLTDWINKILEDKTFCVLSDRQIELEIQTNVELFRITMNEVVWGFSEFYRLSNIIFGQLGPLQEAFRKHLQDYLRAKSYHHAQNAILGIPMSAPVLNIVARDAAFRIATMGLAGIGVLVGIIAIYAWVQANQKFKESKDKDCLHLNLESIPGWNQSQSKEQQMKVVEKYLKDIVISIQTKNDKIKNLLDGMNWGNDGTLLKTQMENTLRMKKAGSDFTDEQKRHLKESLTRLKEKVIQLRDCI